MPHAALQMITYFRKLLNFISSPKRLALVLTAFFILSVLTATTVGARIAVGDFGEALKSNTYNGESNGFQTTYYTVESLSLMIGGCQSDQPCPEEAQVGAIGVVGNMITGLYASPPASGVMYAYDVIHNFGAVDKAYAQTGIGFTALSPLLPLWRGFRDFAYVLFVFAFVLMGFAIMFRMKLNPQTVISVQSALPRVVAGLLFVTFSYAIAGFVIDLIYLFIALIALMFGGVADSGALQNDFNNNNGAHLFKHIWTAIPLKTLATAIGSTIGSVAGLASGALLKGILVGGGLVLLILAAITLFLFFHLFIQLLRAYVAIILAVIFGPIQIALGIIPGMQQFGFGPWLRNLFANAMIFPAVAFVLMLARVIKDTLDLYQGAGLWQAPFLGSASFTGPLIGFGMLFILTQVPEIVKKSIGATELQFKVGAGWREAGGELVEHGGGAFAGYKIGGKVEDYISSGKKHWGIDTTGWTRIQNILKARRII